MWNRVKIAVNGNSHQISVEPLDEPEQEPQRKMTRRDRRAFARYLDKRKQTQRYRCTRCNRLSFCALDEQCQCQTIKPRRTESAA